MTGQITLTEKPCSQSLQKVKSDLSHRADKTPFNSQLPQSEKSNGNLHRIPSNQTNASEIPQECQSRTSVEFCEVVGGGYFSLYRKYSIFFHNQGDVPLWKSLL